MGKQENQESWGGERGDGQEKDVERRTEKKKGHGKSYFNTGGKKTDDA